jgi:hypothetical protein
MTVVTFTSVKGAPGVTTLACLVGATWPDHRQVAVVESDPFGGDLAARFGLSAKRGWSTFTAASRRVGPDVQLEPHLQQLPGGLDVLVDPGAAAVSVARPSLHRLSGDRPPVDRPAVDLPSVANLIDCSATSRRDGWDLLVDAGRLLLEQDRTGEWLDSSDIVVVMLRSDAPSVLKVADRSVALRARCGERVSLVVVGRGDYDNHAIEQFTGIPVIGRVPFDPTAAAVAAGEGGGSHRLSRSLLVASARRLAVVLGGPDGTGCDSRSDGGDRSVRSRKRATVSASTPVAAPSSASTEVARWPAFVARRPQPLHPLQHLRRIQRLRRQPNPGATPAETSDEVRAPNGADPAADPTHQEVTT